MKTKYILLGIVIFFLANGIAQNNSRTVSFLEFKEIKVYDGLWVNLIPADYNKAVISGDYVDDVQLINNNNQLKIRMKIKRFFRGYGTKVDLYFSASPSILDVNEEAKITLTQTLKTDILELKSQEGGQIEVKAQTEQLLIRAVTGGIIGVNGFSKNQDVILNTGGIYKGEALKTEFTTVQVNAGGTAHVFATNYVKAMVKAGGVIEVFGNPKRLEEKKVLGGKIVRKG